VNTSNDPGRYDGQQPITDLLRDVCGLADEAAERITDSAVNARLDSVMRKAGYTSGAEHEVSPAEILAVARREAEEILAAARRGAAEAAAEAACAEIAAQAARRETEQVTAQAEQYQDAALKKAASLVTEARAPGQPDRRTGPRRGGQNRQGQRPAACSGPASVTGLPQPPASRYPPAPQYPAPDRPARGR
jgi:hypothetical protein